MSERPWHRLHWVTWVVLIVVGYSMLSVQQEISLDFRPGEFRFLYGWPVWFRDGLANQSHPYSAFAIAINIAFCGLGFVSSLLVAELFSRRRVRSRQYSLIRLMAAVAGLGIVFGVVRMEAQFFMWSRNPSWVTGGWSSDIPIPGEDVAPVEIHTTSDPLRWTIPLRYPWIIGLPILFAVTCTIYSAGWLAALLIRRVFKPPHGSDQSSLPFD